VNGDWRRRRQLTDVAESINPVLGDVGVLTYLVAASENISCRVRGRLLLSS